MDNTHFSRVDTFYKYNNLYRGLSLQSYPIFIFKNSVCHMFLTEEYYVVEINLLKKSQAFRKNCGIICKRISRSCDL